MFPILLPSKAVVPYVAPTSGLLYTWGANGSQDGQLGHGDTTEYSSPVVVGASNWVLCGINTGSGYGVTSDGKMWAWGLNTSGQLMLSNTTNTYSSPIQVGSLTNWNGDAGPCNAHVMWVKSDGTLWGAGYNGEGQLGLSTTLAGQSSPTQVGSQTDWTSVGKTHAHASGGKRNGTIWGWGQNTNGRLGIGSTTRFCSPIQIGALTTWANHDQGSYGGGAVKTDGSLWIWGLADQGQTGQGDLTDTSSPVQVGALTNWSQVSYCALTWNAVKTDGTLWGCGHNGSGRIGDGTRTNRSSPVQIGAKTNWAIVRQHNSGGMAITTDGKLFSWGENADGSVGDGTTTGRSSPVQVGADNGWVPGGLGSGIYSGIAIRGTPG